MSSEPNAPRRRRRPTGGALLLLIAVGSSSCNRPAPRTDQEGGQLVVFAAASLRDPFTRIGREFERSRPGVALTFNFAGTQELRTQIEQGAAADVLASADQRHMSALAASARVSAPVVFARNEPVLVVSTEAIAKIRGLADLPNASRIIVGAPEVPIGRYTLEILERASATMGADFRSRVEAKVVSRELNVRQVLAKVSLGEGDAGFVYRTDAIAAKDRVGVITIPLDINVVAEYPIAIVSDARHPVLARAWVDYVTSQAGQQALHDAGFSSPDAGGSP